MRVAKILPCPFCGRKAEIQQFAYPRNLCRVICTSCRCSTYGHDGDHGATPSANRAAQVAAWNRRTAADLEAK